MDPLGSEVGHKMRAAIKAKLNELGCYVDDELPDYVMVMVANKRSRMQMEDDLQLFLGSRTEMFVHWLHQVLQKLQEVKIPPLGSSIDGLRRQSSSDSNITVKKERKDKRHKKKKEEKHKKNSEKRPGLSLSLESDTLNITDLLANQLLETVKNSNPVDENIKLESVSSPDKTVQKILPIEKDITDDFDIPTISEIEKESSKLNVQLSEIKELEIDEKIETARQELEVMQSDSDEDVININNDGEELLEIEEQKSTSKHIEQDKIVVEPSTPPRKPISERLGQKFIKVAPTVQNRVKSILNSNVIDKSLENRMPLNRQNKSRDRSEKNGIHRRLGNRFDLDNNRLSSKIIAVSPTVQEDREDSLSVSIPSVVKVKPRPQVPVGMQANRNLILKAMAEAQKSIAQVVPRPQIVLRKPLELYTKKYRPEGRKQITYGIPMRRTDMRVTVHSEEINSIIDDDSMEYTPEPMLNIGIDNSSDVQEYIPSLITKDEEMEKKSKLNKELNLTKTTENEISNPQFVVTLDGLDTSQFPSRKRKLEALKTSKIVITNTDKTSIRVTTSPPKKIEKRKHTPIVFNKDELEPDTKMELDQNVKKDDSDKELMERVNDTVKIIINDSNCVDDPNKQDLSIVNTNGEKTVKLKEKQSKYDHIPAVLSEVGGKRGERCKFYPSCRLGAACEYLHPGPPAQPPSGALATPCKAFPACKFGPACLYQHPRCRYGADCARKRDCIYSHSTVTQAPQNMAAPPVLPSAPMLSSVAIVPNTIPSFKSAGNATTGVMCRFYPQCSNPQCLFYHPKMCRFGKYCHNKAECNFYHPEMSSKEKFTWKPSAFTAT